MLTGCAWSENRAADAVAGADRAAPTEDRDVSALVHAANQAEDQARKQVTGQATGQANNAADTAEHAAAGTAAMDGEDDTGTAVAREVVQVAGITADAGEDPGGPRMILKSINSRDPYLPEQVDFVNGLLRFAQTVTVLTEVEEGPLFDPDTQEIWMPGSFADVIESYFDDEEAPVADVYLHTLVHEVGHVLYSQYDLPLLAREEDAADALASVLLLEYAENGAAVVLNAANMFGLESEDPAVLEESDFWSEHSLDIQRYYTTLCHVYGSDPAAHADLVDAEIGLSPERAEACEYEYERIRKGWLDVLRPYLKR
jgi:hypothetical protein